MSLELTLAPEHAARLFRQPAIAAARQGRSLLARLGVTWYECTEPGRWLAESGESCRLERPRRRFGLAAGCEVLEEASSPAQLGERPVPAVAFIGRERTVRLRIGDAGDAGGDAGENGSELTLRLLEGSLRDITRVWPCCRLTLEGDPETAAALALALGEKLALLPASRSLGEDAMRHLRDVPAPAVEAIGAETTLDEAMRVILGGLAAAMIHWGPHASEGATPLGVHQMRVALRRLRSAILVFKAPLGGSLDEIRPALHELGAKLGAARDWDVFLDGTGSELGQAMAGDRRICCFIEDAVRSREAAYAALKRHLALPSTRRLLLRLGLLPWLAPWRAQADPALLATEVGAFAPRILDRRYKRLVGGLDELTDLAPDMLHEARKSGKKLRYALEFFAPVLPRRPARKLARRLTRAQDEMGAISDTRAGAALIARLTRGGRHEFASGAVLGWLGAKAEAARGPLAETWAGLRRQNRFWRQRRMAES